MNLPVKFMLNVTYPPITSYPQYAGPLSLIYACENAKSWFCNTYIQLFTDHRNPISGGIRFRQELFLKYCPFFKMFALEDYRFFTDKNKLINDIKKILSNNYAVAINVDRDFIPLIKNAYHFIHSVYIYGYDDEKQEFTISDFVSESGSFTLTTIPYKNLQESLDSMNETDYTVKYSSNKFFIYLYDAHDFHYVFDIKKLCHELGDYYNCENTMDVNCYEVYNLYKTKDNNVMWGIDVYNWLSEYLSEFKDSIDYHSIYVLLDHKKSMLLRIDYLESIHLLKDYLTLKQGYNELLNKIKVLLNLSIKYNLTRDKKIVDKMQVEISVIKKLEKDMAYMFLESIQIES